MTPTAWQTALAVALGALVGVGLNPPLRAQTTKSVWDGVYTETQAKRGADLYDSECAGCHGPGGAGGSMAPALSGAAFSANYDGQSIGDLYERNRTTMPIGREGKLSAQQNADVIAFILQVNQFPPGAAELPTQGMLLKQIQFVAQKP